MYSVLFKFSVSLFASNHQYTFSKLAFRRYCNSSPDLPLVEIFVSSANTLAEDEVRQFGRSFIYHRNKSGPRLDPCGIPHLTVLTSKTIIPFNKPLSIFISQWFVVLSRDV